MVCANCHVEYYFKGDGKYLTFPWENGTRIEQIDAYYQEIGFSDWKHPDSQDADAQDAAPRVRDSSPPAARITPPGCPAPTATCPTPATAR